LGGPGDRRWGRAGRSCSLCVCMQAMASRWAVVFEERRLLTVKVKSAVQELPVTRLHGDTFPVKNTGKFSRLVFGNFDEATTALENFLCVYHRKHLLRMARRASLSLHPSTLPCTPQPSPAPLNPHLHPSTPTCTPQPSTATLNPHLHLNPGENLYRTYDVGPQT